ncbi:MAG TPA: hypothetical protein VM074_11735 [Solimonas sp.]|nr:hypothetical protein [Solimonas sp.]
MSWDALSAVATFLAVLVALGLPLWQDYTRQRHETERSLARALVRAAHIAPRLHDFNEQLGAVAEEWRQNNRSREWLSSHALDLARVMEPDDELRSEFRDLEDFGDDAVAIAGVISASLDLSVGWREYHRASANGDEGGAIPAFMTLIARFDRYRATVQAAVVICQQHARGVKLQTYRRMPALRKLLR